VSQIYRGTQKWILLAGLGLLWIGMGWVLESLAQGHAVVWFKSATHTGAVAWVVIGLVLSGGAYLVVSSWLHLRRFRK